VAGVVGTTCSVAAISAAPLVTGAGLSMISPSNTSPLLTSDGAGVPGPHFHEGYWRTSGNDLHQGAAVAGFLHDHLGVTAAAAVHTGDAYTESLAEAFVRTFKRDYARLVPLPGAGTGALAGTQHGGKQLALADRIVLDPGVLDMSETHARLERLNPFAGRVLSDQPIRAHTLLGAGLETRLLDHDLGNWLASPHYRDSDRLDSGLYGFAIEFAHALNWDALHGWLNAGTQTNGDVMYRTKGAVRIEGMDGPVILNGVQHVFQPPQQMPGVTVDRSRLLFITADLDRAAVETSLRDDLPQFLRLSRERAERAARAAADPSIPF